MKIESNMIEIIARMNLTTLNAPGWKNGSPNASELIALCSKDRQPPVKSSRTLASDQPTVLFHL